MSALTSAPALSPLHTRLGSSPLAFAPSNTPSAFTSIARKSLSVLTVLVTMPRAAAVLTVPAALLPVFAESTNGDADATAPFS